MKISEYLENRLLYSLNDTFEENFKILLEQCKEENTIVACFDELLQCGTEKGERLIEIIECDKKTKEEILSKPFVFSKVCTLGDEELINYFHQNLKSCDHISAIKECILSNNKRNIEALEKVFNKEDIFTEHNIKDFIVFREFSTLKRAACAIFLENLPLGRASSQFFSIERNSDHTWVDKSNSKS